MVSSCKDYVPKIDGANLWIAVGHYYFDRCLH